MATYYEESTRNFTLFHDVAVPNWRQAQRGALGALLAHWAIFQREPALIAVPTGSGKTAIALAAPYLARSHRTLVIVPSMQLREQTIDAFQCQDILRQIGAVAGNSNPRVLEVKGRLKSWSDCANFDVVVALPQSISPDHYDEDQKPPPNLFDLIIIDEEHHVPAPTWRAILEHFGDARKVLLTATPRRRDGKHLPGAVVFHYPLRAAIADGYYKQVEARLLKIRANGRRSESDLAIRDEIVKELERPDHATSTLLIRAGDRSRVRELAALYGQVGLEVATLTSDLGEKQRSQIVAALKNGEIRAVAVVGMLGEGFDLPRLRLAAYHDKHKSITSTIQLIGRLVRSHPDFPQPSVLVTVRDADVYPALKGALRSLYEEDADWSTLLPGIIDDSVQRVLDDKAFTDELTASPVQLSLDGLRPLVRATVLEALDDWKPAFVNGWIPEELRRGESIWGQKVLYSTLTPNNQTLLLVTQSTRSPRWQSDSGLDAPEYALHLITFLPATERLSGSLLLVNSSDSSIMPTIREILDITTEHLQPADPERLQRAFDALPRLSVSNVGVRNIHGGGRGSASYKMFAGSGVDRGIREADTAQAAIGHSMAQVDSGPESNAYNSGFSVAKAKMWESRYVPLRDYDGILSDFAHRYWSSTESMAPLLPSVARGVRINSFPRSDVAALEMHPRLLASEWTTQDGFPIGRIDLQRTSNPSTDSELEINAVRRDTGDTIWSGFINKFGFVVDNPTVLTMFRGHQTPRPLADLLTANPPTIYFLNGETVSGATLYRPPTVQRDLTRWRPILFDWSTTNIEKETDRSARKAKAGDSIHETMRNHLANRPTTARKRWILENDGSGELADLIVLELLAPRVLSIELWHAKSASGRIPSVRVTDMQVVVAQAIKSRRWLTDRGLWREMADRYSGHTSPRLALIDGDESLLNVLFGTVPDHPTWSLVDKWTQLSGKVVIAQPGLSWSQLEAKVERNELGAIQIRDLLAVFDDALGALGDSEIVCSQ